MVPLLALGLLLGADAPQRAPTSGFDGLAIPPEVVGIARGVVNQPLAERMAAISEPFLGMPYVDGALGEGVPPDDDPIARYDVFDCVTFVEEVLALSLPGDVLGAPWVRAQIRWRDGEADYAKRRHFMLQQWIPENIDNGWIRDITAEVGPATAITKEVSPAVWRSWKGRSGFALTDDQLPVGSYDLLVLSLDDALANIDRIPPGTIVSTVRQPREWVPIVITHVGFVVAHPDGQSRIRHATRMSDKKVIDHRLSWYLEHVKSYKNWPVVGINLLFPVEQGPRRGLLVETRPVVGSGAGDQAD